MNKYYGYFGMLCTLIIVFFGNYDGFNIDIKFHCIIVYLIWILFFFITVEKTYFNQLFHKEKIMIIERLDNILIKHYCLSYQTEIVATYKIVNDDMKGYSITYFKKFNTCAIFHEDKCVVPSTFKAENLCDKIKYINNDYKN